VTKFASVFYVFHFFFFFFFHSGLPNSPCLIPCCDAHYDFRVKTMFASSWLPFACREFMLHKFYLYLLTHTGVLHDFPTRWYSFCLPVTRWCRSTFVLSVILRYTDSDYPFDIFKLLLPSVFSWVCVAQSLVFFVVFCPFYFGHCVVCPSPIYGFWFPLWYLKTLLT